MYDPGVFTHSPCAQGFLSHSSSSAEAKELIKPFSPSYCASHIFRNLSSLLQPRTDTLSSNVKLEAHVALAAIVTARQGDTSTVHAEVADGLAHVGC